MKLSLFLLFTSCQHMHSYINQWWDIQLLSCWEPPVLHAALVGTSKGHGLPKLYACIGKYFPVTSYVHLGLVHLPLHCVCMGRHPTSPSDSHGLPCGIAMDCQLPQHHGPHHHGLPHSGSQRREGESQDACNFYSWSGKVRGSCVALCRMHVACGPSAEQPWYKPLNSGIPPHMPGIFPDVYQCIECATAFAFLWFWLWAPHTFSLRSLFLQTVFGFLIIPTCTVHPPYAPF